MTDFSHDTADDAFHEIQLSGKQLVFLFMATTVVSVVIFLCGVLVGRGVKTQEDVATQASASAPLTPPAATPEPIAEPAAAPSDPPAPSTDAGLSYHDRLQSEKPVVEQLKSRPERAATVAPKRQAAQPEAEPSPAPPPSTPAATPAAEPRAGRWAVQVVSLRDRAAAARIVDRLKGKGYPAFLVTPAAGAPAPLFKVQVGRFNDRREAEQISARLKTEERFDTWIVR